ncbi:MAG: hypothetical protein ACKOA9_02410 [Actinomycetota bacterium]
MTTPESTPKTTPRPAGITLIAVLASIGFLAQILVSIASLRDADRLSQEFGWGLTEHQIVARGVAGIVVGVIGLLLTAAFARGSRVVRILFTVLVVFQVAGGVLTMRQYDGIRPGAGVMSLVFGVVVLYLLFNSRADDYFAKD